MLISRCFKAVCTGVFSRTFGDTKAPSKDPFAGITAWARSKSSADALATIPRSFLKEVSCLPPPKASFVLCSRRRERSVLAKTMAKAGVSHRDMDLARYGVSSEGSAYSSSSRSTRYLKTSLNGSGSGRWRFGAQSP